MLILTLLLIIIGLASVNLGTVKIAPEVIRRFLAGDSGLDVNSRIILQKIRIPRTVGALTGGAALAVAGLLLQVFFRNPVVDAFILGISSGAGLLVGVVMMAGISFSGIGAASVVFLAAFTGSLAVMLIMMLFAGKARSPITLLVIGVMIGYLCGAVNSLLMAFTQKEQLQGFIFWAMGSFAGFSATRTRWLLLLTCPALSAAFLFGKQLNLILLGETYARSMGVNIRRTRLGLILISSLLAGVVTACAGPVAFIGLAVPHITRRLLGSGDNRLLLPATAICGAVVTGGCDLVARLLLKPVELPLSAITSLIGAPVVIYLLLRREPK